MAKAAVSSDLDITQLARRTGLPASTLRFYEDKGLIASIGRRGLKRLFDPGIVERLALIGLARSAGFALDDIARMFTPDGLPQIDRQMLTAKADELQRMIDRLGAMRDGLRHAAACPAPNHMECPTFRRILRASAARPFEAVAVTGPGFARAARGRPRRKAQLTP